MEDFGASNFEDPMTEEKASRERDTELLAMTKIIKTLIGLPPEAAERILSYVTSRFHKPN
jgi:hypothetical protein